jgi:hypothetical protein
MSEIKLFNIQSNTAAEIAGSASGLEKPLQTLFEQNLDTLLGVRFLASEHSTGIASVLIHFTSKLRWHA